MCSCPIKREFFVLGTQYKIQNRAYSKIVKFVFQNLLLFQRLPAERSGIKKCKRFGLSGLYSACVNTVVSCGFYKRSNIMQHLHGWSRWSCSFARTPWSPKLSETCSRAIILSSAWCFCCSSTFKATHEKHGAKYLQSWLGNNIQVHHSWKKTAAHQLYSHSGYHIIQDPIKTSSTSIQLTCIFWPQYPTLPHKTSKILLVLSSSRRSLSFSPLSSADLPKWVKPGKPWKPRIQGRPPEVWDKNQELRPLVSCQNVGQTKGFEVLMCFIRSKKKTHTPI